MQYALKENSALDAFIVGSAQNYYRRTISWQKIRLFLQCPTCFYREQCLGIKRPDIDPDCFTLPIAVETLLKKEFDYYRKENKSHPIMLKNNIDAIPFLGLNDVVEKWKNPCSRNYVGGIRFYDSTVNIELLGGIDDVWINPQGELIIVEYKTTSIRKEIDLDDKNPYHKEYMKQVAFYAWLLKKQGYKVSNVGYFIFCNGLADKPFFNDCLNFELSLHTCKIDDTWIDDVIGDIFYCLNKGQMPLSTKYCKFCVFARQINLNINIK